MDDITLWNVTAETPQRFQRGQIALESSLEAWIEREPSLVLEGMVIVGRQVQTDAGSIELLGIDPMGQWVVIEIKRGGIRKETLTQAIAYASAIGKLDEDELINRIDSYLKPRKTDTQ